MPSRIAAWWPQSEAFAARFRRGSRHEQVESRSKAGRTVLFTDPDTLREEGGRGWAGTLSALRTLEERGIAIVLCGNQTRSEMELIQSDLNIHHPFISENGGGLFVPHGYFRDQPVDGRTVPHYNVVEFGKPYYRVAQTLHEVADKLRVKIIGFSDMSIQEVAQACGLSLAEARLAKLREYDEPFRMFDATPATCTRISSALRRLGLHCFEDSAFHHATGVADRTHSFRSLTSLYRAAHHGEVFTVGLAKEPSETSILQAVDIPVLVQSHPMDGAPLWRKVPTARLISAGGPRAWCRAILQLLDGQPRGHLAASRRPSGGPECRKDGPAAQTQVPSDPGSR